MDRIQSMGQNRQLGGLVLVILLAVAIGGVLFVRSFGGKSEAEQAKDVLDDALQLHADGKLDAAEDAYLRVIQLDPQNKYAYYNLGLISQTRGDVVGAETNYGTAVTIDPDFVPALFNLAILRTDSGADQEAIHLYEHVIEVEPDNASAHLNLGFLLIDNGDEDEGQAELETAVQLDPSLEGRIGSAAVGASPSP